MSYHLWNSKSLYNIRITLPTNLVLKKLNLAKTAKSYFCKIRVDTIIFLHKTRMHQYARIFPWAFCSFLILFNDWHVFLSHLPQMESPHNSWWSEHNMKILITNCSLRVEKSYFQHCFNQYYKTSKLWGVHNKVIWCEHLLCTWAVTIPTGFTWNK